MEELGLFPENATQSTQVILLSLNEECLKHAAELASKFRKEGIPTEVYPTAAKMKKQMKYANDRGIPFAIIIGESEMSSLKYTTKTMSTGESKMYSNLEAIKFFNEIRFK
jgi:histidyl-tRNA synthetase